MLRRYCQAPLIASVVLASSVALPSHVALAAEPRIVTVDGRDFAVVMDNGAAVVVPTPRSVRLVRDARAQPTAPACSHVEAQMPRFASQIESCQMDPGGGSCSSLTSLINNVVRFLELAPLPLLGLPQPWRNDSAEPTGGPREDQVRAAVASAVGVGVDAVYYRDRIRPAGHASSILVAVNPAGGSWASKLFPFIDVAQGEGGGPAVTYDALNQWFVTKDHVLACGLLAGDVRIDWRQNATAQVPTAGPGLFAAADLWKIYQALGGVPAETDPVRRAIAVGSRVGAALAQHGFTGSDLKTRIDFVMDIFFDEDTLAFEGGLAQAEVERRSNISFNRPVDVLVAWRGVVVP